MKFKPISLILFILVLFTACQPAPPPSTPSPDPSLDITLFFESLIPAEPTNAPAPTATAQPTSTMAPTTTALPSTEEILAGFLASIRPQLDRLKTALQAPAGFTLPPASDWRIRFLPLDERGYFVQQLLIQERTFGNPAGNTNLYIAYSYVREGCLGVFYNSCDIQDLTPIAKLYVEADGATYFLEELPSWAGGAGSNSDWNLIEQATYNFFILGEEDGSDIERLLELLIGFTTGLDPVDAIGNYFTSPGLPARLAILRQALGSINWSDRDSAAFSLSELGPEAAPAVPELIRALGDEESDVRQGAVEALRAIGPAASEAVPALISIVQTADSDLQCSAIAALGEIGSAERVVPVLIPVIESGENCLSITAEALGNFGEAASGAVPALVQILATGNEDEREEASDALGKLGPSAVEAVPALIGALEDERRIACSATRTLGLIGSGASAAVPKILELLDKDEYCELDEIGTLGQIGPAAADAVPVLIGYLDFGVFVWQPVSAADALAKIGPPAVEAVPALIRMLQDGAFGQRTSAYNALRSITGYACGQDPVCWQAWWDQNKP